MDDVISIFSLMGRCMTWFCPNKIRWNNLHWKKDSTSWNLHFLRNISRYTHGRRSFDVKRYWNQQNRNQKCFKLCYLLLVLLSTCIYVYIHCVSKVTNFYFTLTCSSAPQIQIILNITYDTFYITKSIYLSGC